jgi:SAM-dependent methyltransferase
LGVPEFHDHFSTRAVDYAVYRPTYPPALIAYLAQLAPARDLAWDAGTGNGQAAVMFAAHFARVVATDASPEQIKRAQANPKVSYRVAREGDSGLEANSVDLATVAQALHWFDVARYYAEAQRVLKPRGVCAAWTYGMPHIDPETDAAWSPVHAREIERHWPPERAHVNAMYMDLPFPFEEIAPEPREMTARLTREQFLGYVGTWSAVARARESTGADPVAAMRAALESVWSGFPEDVRTVTWPIGMRVGRKAN